MISSFRFATAVASLAVFLTMHAGAGAAEARVFNIREHGAAGDGRTLDTAAIAAAIDACATAGGGQVLFPPGRYLSGTVRLRSHVTLFLAAGATLAGTTNLDLYAAPALPADFPGPKSAKWYRALLLGENLEDITLAGPGTVDGNRVFDPHGEERMRGPHALVLSGCRGLKIHDVKFLDAANYAVFLLVTDQVDIRRASFTGGWDGVHLRGAPGRPCRDVTITECRFNTGDDAIAGWYWERALISRCKINSSCNGLRLIGPATQLTVSDCQFYGPGTQPHRSSGPHQRTNMLCGIILQPGAWDKTEGLLDGVLITNVTMRQVAAPVTLWTRPGNPVGRVTIDRLNATGIYRSALSIESWSGMPITNVVVRHSNLEFTGGGTAEAGRQPVRGPGVDARPLPAWGVYARHVEQLVFENVRVRLAQNDFRPVLFAEDVQRLNLDGFQFPRVPGVAEPLVTTNVTTFTVRVPVNSK